MFSKLIILLPIYIFATPIWFHHTTTKSYEIVGYGVDNDLQIARDIAKAEISKQISVKISSNTNLNKSIQNNNYKKTFQNHISTSSSSILNGIKILKEEKEDNQWYVVAIYDNRTLISKIQDKYPKYKKSNLKDIKNLNIIREHNNWYLKIKNDLYFLDKQNFLNIFSNTQNKDIKFNPNKTKYNSYDEMRFDISTTHKGYISILYSEANGKVGVILSNNKIKKNLIYPNKKDENQLIAYNPSSKTIIEWYICVYSSKKLDLSEFENISENPLDESNYNFDKLLDIIKYNKYSSVKVKIRGK